MEVPGRIGSINVEVGQNFGTLVVGDHNVVQVSGASGPVVMAKAVAAVHRPTDPTGFLDRRAETARAIALLQPGAALELHGAARIGKTWLACHTVTQAGAAFRDGALLLPPGLAGARDALQSMFEIFHDSTPEYAPSATRLREYLGDRQALLVADDAAFSGRDLKAFFDAARGCALLLAHDGPPLADAGAAAIALGGLPLDDALALMEREHGGPFAGPLAVQALAQCEALAGHPQRLLEAARQLDPVPAAQAPLTDDERIVLDTLRAFAPRSVPSELLPELSGVPDAVAIFHRLQAAGRVPALPAPLPAPDALARQVEGLGRLGHAATANPARRRKALAALPLLWLALAQAREQGASAAVLALGQAWHAPLALAGRFDAWGRVLDAHLQAARALGDAAAAAWALHQGGTREMALSQLDAARESFRQSLQAGAGDPALQAATRHHLDLLGAAVGMPPPAIPRLKLLGGLGIVAVGAAGAWIWGAPRLVLDADRIDFKPVALSAAAPAAPAVRTVIVRNSGWRAATVVAPVAPAPFAVDASDCTARPLAGGASCSLRVDFAPSVRGEASASVALAGEGGPTLALHGRALAGQLALVDRVDFGAMDVGAAPLLRVVEVRNSGDADVRIQRPAVLRAPFGLARDDCHAAPLAPGASCRIELRYGAAGARRDEATLVLRSDEPGRAEQRVALVGEGRAGAIALDNSAVEFGRRELGSEAVVRDVTVRNTGNAPLRLALTPSGADFAVEAQDCTRAAVAPGQRCVIRVRFLAAGTRGAREASLRLTAPAAQPATVPLRATVLAAALAVEPPRVDFGKQEWPLAAPVERSVRIVNRGDAPLRGVELRTAGSMAADWRVAPNCAGEIAPGAGCDALIAYRPGAPRQSAAQLLVSARLAQPASATVELSGETRVSKLAAVQLVLPPAGLEITCAAARAVPMVFSWRPPKTGGAPLRFRLETVPGGQRAETSEISWSESLRCPGGLRWRVVATADGGASSTSEWRTLRLTLAPAPTPAPTPPPKPAPASPPIAAKDFNKLKEALVLPGTCCVTDGKPFDSTESRCKDKKGMWTPPTQTAPKSCPTSIYLR